MKHLTRKEARKIAREEAMKVVTEAFHVFNKALGSASVRRRI